MAAGEQAVGGRDEHGNAGAANAVRDHGLPRPITASTGTAQLGAIEPAVTSEQEGPRYRFDEGETFTARGDIEPDSRRTSVRGAKYVYIPQMATSAVARRTSSESSMSKRQLNEAHAYENPESKRTKFNTDDTPKRGDSAARETQCLRRFRVPHDLHRLGGIDLQYRNSYLKAEEVDVHGIAKHQEVALERDEEGFFSGEIHFQFSDEASIIYGAHQQGEETEEYLFECWRFSLQMVPREPCEVQARTEGLKWTDIEDRHRKANAWRYELGRVVEEERRVLVTVRGRTKRWKAIKNAEDARWERATRVAASALALSEREELEWRTESRKRRVARLKDTFRANEKRHQMPYDLSYEDQKRVEEWSSDDDN
ncbi:hypothetical protein DFP72DRAFT_1064893 [Ephemerocybe angulata]|uniref:Uncharacterized protein n=1 Tax=Ephemerocybe angulata TaxID=980116 RepID=A0A8H6I663_9AGAR|nr:hypothetical protein DFP72DRAFT_1064893 [Tulosesus angulatus]